MCSARRLKIQDKAALFANIAARHPTLKQDVTALTELLSYFFYNKVLPEWKIPLEDLPKADIATRRQRGLQGLIDFVDIFLHYVVEGEDKATLQRAPLPSSLTDPSICDYGYQEDQATECTPLSPADKQEFIPPGSDAVLGGLGFDTSVLGGADERIHELSYMGIGTSPAC